MRKKGKPHARTVRIQLDISKEARRNLQRLADHDQRTLGYVLDELLTKHLPKIAVSEFGPEAATLFERAP